MGELLRANRVHGVLRFSGEEFSVSDLTIYNKPRTTIDNGANSRQVRLDLTLQKPRSLPVDTDNDYTLTRYELGGTIRSNSALPVNLFLPPGLPAGVVHVFQAGGGQISFIPTEGATVVDGLVRSAGQYTDMGKFVRIESFGDDTYVVSGDITEGVLEWSIIGPESLEEGDSAVYVIYYPDSVNADDEGATITISGSDFAASGLDQSLQQALANLALLEPLVEFDGNDQLRVYPGAINPLPIHLFAVPQYSELGNRTFGITISNPSVGEIAFEGGAVTTNILNVSKPWNPVDFFPPYTATVGATVSSSSSAITLQDASDVKLYSTVTHASIPALTYVSAINGNVITLSANTTGSIANGTTLTFKPPGWVLNMTDPTKMTLDGSNRCSQMVDSVHGFPFTQATQANQMIYDSAAINGVGGLTSNGSRFLRSTNPAVAKLADAAKQKWTLIVVGRLNSFAGTTVNWVDGPVGMQAHATAGAFKQAVASTGILEILAGDAVGEPYVWLYENDGTSDGGQIHCNSQRQLVPMTVTDIALAGQKVIKVDDTSNVYPSMTMLAQPYGGLKATVPCTVGINSGSQTVVTSVDSATQITVNTNLVQDLQVGQTIWAFSAIGYNRPPGPARTTTNFTVGATKTTSVGVAATFEYVIFMPRLLSLQEKRGFAIMVEDQLGTEHTTTADGDVSAGAYKIKLASLTNVHMYQTVSGTNIKPGSTIVKIKTSTKEIWLDEKVQTGGITSGATITFHHLGIKRPDMMDVSQMIPLYREDYVNGPTLTNSGRGQKPYSGDPLNPGTFNGAYGAYGHGSSNNPSVQREWNLDVLNWVPWQKYTPFSQYKDESVPKGGLKITAKPTPPELVGLLGYDAIQGLQYTYISGFLRDGDAFSFQYGYCEGRMKFDDVVGMWVAFWLLAKNGGYPPEIDIVEQYGHSFASTQSTNHMCKTFNLDFAQQATGNHGEILTDLSERYAMFGVDVTPERVDFYMNREKYFSITMQWDFHTPWYIIIDLAIQNLQGGVAPDGVSWIDMFVDYLAVWRYPDQEITPTGDEQAETTALLAAMSVQPSAGRKTIINTAIEKLKLYQTSFGVPLWDALDFLVVGWAHDAQAARIDWKDPASIGTVVGSPTFTVDRGYKGTLNTAYIDMGYDLSAESGFDLNSTLNQCSMLCYADSITATTAIAMGTTKFKMNPRSGNVLNTSLWSTADKTAATKSTGGHYAATRNHFQYNYFHNGVLANDGLGTGKPSTQNNTRSTNTETLKIANGAAQVGYAAGGDYLTPDDIRYFTSVMDELGRAIGAIT